MASRCRNRSRRSYWDIQEAANKLRGQVRSLLQEYYTQNPDAEFRLEVIDEKDRFEPFLRSSKPKQASDHQGIAERVGLSISSLWRNDHVHELMRTVCRGAELRLHITGFVDIRVMRTTLQRALDQGARIRILQTDPECPVFEARFRLRPEMELEKFRAEMRQQQEILRALAAKTPSGSLELRPCNLMPFGCFIQGDSPNIGPWMIIGLLPATASYSDGPMIKLRPSESDLWNVFDRCWSECWNDSNATAAAAC